MYFVQIRAWDLGESPGYTQIAMNTPSRAAVIEMFPGPLPDKRLARAGTGLSWVLVFGSCLICLSGCATYRFDIVNPPDLPRPIGHDQDTVLNVNAMEYRFRAVEDRLVARIYNRGRETVRLLGDQSTVVDPEGQSHPLRGTPLPPGSFMKVVLPPALHVEPTGPSIGFGFGYSSGYGGPGRGSGMGIYDPASGATTYSDGQATWEWPANKSARLILVFQIGNGRAFTQEWAFAKRKE